MERHILRSLNSLLIPLLFATGCDRNKADTGRIFSEPTPESCYRWVSGNDTILLSVNAENAVVNGRLAYRFYQKDKSNGTIKGAMIGDTLFVDYSFFSEGMFSRREVAFLREDDNSFTLGAGEISTEGNRNFFTDRKGIHFNTGVKLKPADCREIRW
jgi:hypothetical protein